MWNRMRYWQYPKQQKGYTTVLDALESNTLNTKQRVAIAREAIMLIQALHDQQFAQTQLKAEDIFVTEPTQVLSEFDLLWFIC